MNIREIHGTKNAMTRKVAVCVACFCALLLPHGVALAAPHAEITVMPLGRMAIKRGVQQLTIPLPRYQPLPPLVLASVQPSVQPLANPNPDDENAAAAAPAIQVPATVKFKIGDCKLPDWVLASTPNAYIISPATLRANPGFADGVLRIEAHLLSDADEIGVLKLGMPDPMLLADNGTLTIDGPHSEFVRRAEGKPDVANYFAAQALEFAGDLSAAREAYNKLSNSPNKDVGRYARRALRLLNYRLRERTLSGNYLEHYRWGQFLRFAGLYSLAHDEFGECRLLFPKQYDAQYYAGDTLAMTPRAVFDWLLYLDRAGLAIENDVAVKSRIEVAVIMVRSRNGRELSDDQINAIKDAFICVERIINVASRGRLEIVSYWHTLDNADGDQLAVVPGNVLAATDKLIRPGGWFDMAITVLPRLDGESATDFTLSNGNASTAGAMVANLYHDGGLDTTARLYYALFRQLGKHIPGLASLPDAEALNEYGLRPASDALTHLRATIHDLCPPDGLTGVQIAEPALDESYVQLWRVTSLSAEDLKRCREATDTPSLPIGKNGKNIVIDGKTLPLKNTGKGVVATTWVYLPVEQAVQTRIDAQSIAALTLRCNGRTISNGIRADAVQRSFFARLVLASGWNLLEFIIEPDNAAPASLGLSILDINSKPIAGFACAYRPPSDFNYGPKQLTGGDTHYVWDDVRDDWRQRLPNLTKTGFAGFENWSLQSDGANFVGYFAPAANQSETYRLQDQLGRAEDFRDVRVNNVIDRRREWCAVVSGTQDRQLVFVRPEGLPAIANCIKEVEPLPDRLKGKTAGARLLGYVEVDMHDSRQPLFVFDVAIGAPGTWPADEEDLLTPFGPYIPNDQYFPAPVGPLPASSN